MSNDWFDSLAALEYLGLQDGTSILGRPLSRHKSGNLLVEPKTVHQFDEIVIAKKGIAGNLLEVQLWDVLTRETEDGQIELVGKRWDSLVPFKYKGPKESIGENFVILKHSQAMIRKMAKSRSERVKAGIK
jgi:hypothetical protein